MRIWRLVSPNPRNHQTVRFLGFFFMPILLHFPQQIHKLLNFHRNIHIQLNIHKKYPQILCSNWPSIKGSTNLDFINKFVDKIHKVATLTCSLVRQVSPVWPELKKHRWQLIVPLVLTPPSQDGIGIRAHDEWKI